MRILNVSLCLLGLCVAAVASSNELSAEKDHWVLKRDRHGIQIYTRSVEGSPYKAVKGVTSVNATLSSLVALISDTDACSDWADLCDESSVYESVSKTEKYIYMLNYLPWPVANRDVLVHVVWSQNPDNLSVSIHSQATEGLLEKNKGVVRLTQVNASWDFIPLPDGGVEVTTLAHVNPGGLLPAWITNLLLVDSPFNTLINLKKVVKRPKYQHAEVSFIVEPGS